MKDSLILFTSLFGLLGALAGVFLQAYLSRKTDERNNLSELQHKAYTDFLNTVSNIAVAQRAGKREVVSSEFSKLADAKSRICIYGESTVIHNLAKFIRNGGNLQTESEILSFTKLFIVMRDSVGMKKDGLSTADISQLLFELDVIDVPTPKNG